MSILTRRGLILAALSSLAGAAVLRGELPDQAEGADAAEVAEAFVPAGGGESTDVAGVELADEFRQVLIREGFRFSPAVRASYVATRKSRALAEIRSSGKEIPEAFLAWVDGDEVARTTVYGSPDPAGVLLMLYSLSLDAGEARLKRYRNWLLAAAVVNARAGRRANLAPRPPLKLVVPGDPRKPVNTKDPSRPLDQNDHIINFLEDNRLVASDVMYSADWQKMFNDFMAGQGQPARVDCSMKLGVGTPAQKKPALKKVMDAYRLFQAAYEEKGRIPQEKDPRIGLAEWVVFQIDHHESGTSRSKFPLDRAPWPVLKALLEPRLSLREAHHINQGGEDIIPDNRRKLNAATTEMLKAVDVRPFPFAEGSWWMIKKHGGACGTRAMLAANQNKACGLPSAPVGEIGHASWTEFAYFKKGDRFAMRFEGGGHNPATLSVHLALPISRGREQERASNWGAFLEAIQSHGGVPAYMESMMAYYARQSLTPEERAQHGAQLKADALALHPGNMLLSGVLERNAAESVADRKVERWRKRHAGELLRQQRGRR